MKLFYVPMTRALRPRWMLEEIGAPYELHRLDIAQREHKGHEYMALHALGRVPTLVDGTTTIFESAAIVAHLADKFPAADLAPPLGTPERAHYYQWLFYAMTEMDVEVVRYRRHTIRLPEPERVPAIAEEARGRYREAATGLARLVGDRPFVLGGRFQACDIIVASTIALAGMSGLMDGLPPSLAAYAARCTSRPAAQRALAD